MSSKCQASTHNILDFDAIADCPSVACAQQNGFALFQASKQVSNGDTIVFSSGVSFYYMPFSPFRTSDGVWVEPIMMNLTSVIISLEGVLILHNNYSAWPTYVHGDKNTTSFYNALHCKHCINYTVTGGGSIYGQGEAWWRAFFIGAIPRQRPTVLYLENCADTIIQHITIYDSPRFNIYGSNVNGFIVRFTTLWVNVREQLRIYGIYTGKNVSNLMSIIDRKEGSRLTKSDLKSFPVFPYNTDGIDFHGKNIHIHDLNVSNWDDVVAVKASDSLYDINCTMNVLVERLNIFIGAGLSIGSVVPAKRSRCIRNVTFRDSKALLPLKLIYIKGGTSSNKSASLSAYVRDILYENITAEGSILWPVYLGPQQQSEP